MKKTNSLVVLTMVAMAAVTAHAQASLLTEKPIHTLGPAKTWTAGETSYTFVADDLAKLVATPVNTENVFLYPENGTLNTEANRALGIQGFYIDMEASQAVGTVSTTWEGAAANAYSIYLTDTEPTLDILNTTPTYTASGLGQYTSNTAVMPDGAKGRYLVFQPTDATNWGWGVKIRSIAAAAPVDAELAAFTAAPGIVALGEATPMTLTFKDQLGLGIAADKVTVSVSANATFADGALTVNSGTEATLTATMGDKSLEAKVYVATAPAFPEAADIKTPVFTNTVTDANATAGWVADYNGGAVNAGTITFANGAVAQEFLNTRCVFFYNSATTGGWNAAIKPLDLGYRSLRMSVFGTKDGAGMIEFEGTSGVIEHTQNFAVEAGKWNDVEILFNGENQLNNMSVRFDEANMCDVLLANIYFTPGYVEGDETAPVLGDITATPAMNSIELNLSATDDLSADIYYTIAVGGKTYTTSGKSGEAVVYTIEGLEPATEYTIAVTANDGKNASEPKELKVKTVGMPDAPTPETDAKNVLAVFSTHYGADALPRFDAWGSAATSGTAVTDNGETVMTFANYMGQWGGLVDLDVDVAAYAEPIMHIDILGAATEGTLTLATVWADATGETPNKTVTIEADKWNSVDINLADFGFKNHGTKIIQLAMTNSTLPNFAINNFYFYGRKLTGIEDVTAEGTALVDVYSVQGVRVRANVAAGEATNGLAPGIYIVASGKTATKVLVK